MLALLLLCLATPVILQQPAQLTGRVVDAQSGKPVADAIITIPGAAGTSKTDREGNFVWESAPAVPFQVIVVLPGGQVARPVDVTKIDPTGLVIPVNALADEAVTVVGTAPSIVTAPAAGKTMLSPEQVASRAPENLTQALETVPGINVVSEGHAAVPAVRGLARGRTLVLIDGARVSSERRVGPSATFADPASFEGIDVARGPGSVAYGSEAIGGVISVRTRRAQPGSPFQVRASGTLGGGIPTRRATIELSKGLARGGILVQAHDRAASDWDSPVGSGTVLNSGWKDRGVLARVDHELARGLLTVSYQGDFGRDIERPRDNSHLVRFYYPYENSHRLTGGYELANIAGMQQLAFTGFFGTVEHRTDQDRLATATRGREIERADIAAKDFHLKASGVRGAGRARLEFGVDLNGRFDVEATDASVLYDTTGAIVAETRNLSVGGARRTNTGAYLQVEAPVATSFRVAAGGRGDYVTTENRGGFFGDRRSSNGAFSGFASATAGPFAGFTFTGQVARAFRDPTVSDRYFRGPSGRGFVTGNPDLDPETTLQFDGAARYALGRTQLAAYVYHYRITDLIERFQAAPDFFFFRNRGRARVRGVEFEARAEAGRGFSIEGGLNLARGVALDDDADLDDISADTVFVMLRQDFTATKKGYVQLRAAFAAEDTRPGPSEVEAPGSTIVDLSGGWKLSEHLELRGLLRNLLDEEYYASPDPRWVYAAGRNGSLTLAVQF